MAKQTETSRRVGYDLASGARAAVRADWAVIVDEARRGLASIADLRAVIDDPGETRRRLDCSERAAIDVARRVGRLEALALTFGFDSIFQLVDASRA